jgi:hypothetical protein
MSNPLTPDDRRALLEPSTRRLPLGGGLHPEADVPVQRRTPASPGYTPCPRCGAMVLIGTTTAGVSVSLDVQAQSYTVLWLQERAQPLLYESRGYSVHRCSRP